LRRARVFSPIKPDDDLLDLVNGNNDGIAGAEPNAIRLQRVLVTEAGPRAEVEGTFMERADDGGSADQSVGQRAAAMRTVRLKGEDFAAARPEYRHFVPADVEASPFSRRYLRQGTNRMLACHVTLPPI
jgi:hypothetical protein